jgi:glucans biosynthesis protein
MQSGGGEWLWRPLRNPRERWISSFQDRDPKGFGLMQRDRVFEDYQDLEAFYHHSPPPDCISSPSESCSSGR